MVNEIVPRIESWMVESNSNSGVDPQLDQRVQHCDVASGTDSKTLGEKVQEYKTTHIAHDPQDYQYVHLCVICAELPAAPPVYIASISELLWIPTHGRV